MQRPARLIGRALLAGAVAAAGYLGWISMSGTPAAIDLLPADAGAIVEFRRAGELSRQITGTRFAAAFAKSGTRVWLDRTAAMAAFDTLRAEVGRVTGWTPGRDSVFDLVGSEAAIGWYPDGGRATDRAPWVAGGRMSLRAWAAVGGLRLARRIGLGAPAIAREEIDGSAIYSLAAGDGTSLHLFVAGRLLVAGTGRALVLQAARAARDPGAAVGHDPAWQSVRSALPGRSPLYAWVRDPGWLPLPVSTSRLRNIGVGARIRDRRTVEIDIVADPLPGPAAFSDPAGSTMALPGTALLRLNPLFFLSSSDPAPPVVEAMLQSRRAAATAGRPAASAVAGVLRPGRGYALAVTESAGGSGLFPAPRGLLMFGMASAEEAGRALPLLFPQGARTALVGSARALSTRESFPLAGEFELWGAAIGPQLVFATETALIAAVADVATSAAAGEPADPRPAWRATSLASISVEKALPLLRRWSAPLSGLIGARWPDAPAVAGDLELLGAVRSVRLIAGSDERHQRAAVTLSLRDLP